MEDSEGDDYGRMGDDVGVYDVDPEDYDMYVDDDDEYSTGPLDMKRRESSSEFVEIIDVDSVQFGKKMKSYANREYTVRTPKQFVGKGGWLDSCVENFKNKWEISHLQAIKLFKDNDYDYSKIVKKYGSDTSKVFAHMDTWSEPMYDAEPPTEGKMECAICFDEYDAKDMKCPLPCGHVYCNDCTMDHVRKAFYSTPEKKTTPPKKSTEGPYLLIREKVLDATCPNKDCKCPMPTSILKQFFRHGDRDMDKRNRWVAENMCTKMEFMKKCPSCDRCIEFKERKKDILRSDNEESGQLKCLCGDVMCWLCGKGAHAPLTCSQVEDWNKLSNADQALERLKSQTKKCPKESCPYSCAISAKNACNHMTCVCGHEWCWMCFGDWKTHGGDYFNCAKYKDAANKEIREANIAREKKLADNRRLQKYEEYTLPLLSAVKGKVRENLLESVEQLHNSVQKAQGVTDFELKFIHEAARAVIDVKRMLLWSRVYLYFQPEVEDDSLRTLFTHQIGGMSGLVDKLHIMLCPDAKQNAEMYEAHETMLGFELKWKVSKGKNKTQRKRRRVRASSTPTIPLERRTEAFVEFKTNVINLSERLMLFANKVTIDTLKGMIISDPVQRKEMARRSAISKISSKLVVWERAEEMKWVPLEDDVAVELETARNLSETDVVLKEVRYDIERMTAVPFDSEEDAAAASKIDASKAFQIRRTIHATGASHESKWQCKECNQWTSNDSNTCVYCGKVGR